jgi:hypothetical protein
MSNKLLIPWVIDSRYSVQCDLPKIPGSPYSDSAPLAVSTRGRKKEKTHIGTRSFEHQGRGKKWKALRQAPFDRAHGRQGRWKVERGRIREWRMGEKGRRRSKTKTK